MTTPYIIVGAEVDNPRRHVDAAGRIVDAPGPDTTPLTVEYIGRLLVGMSQHPPDDQTRARNETLVLNAMRVMGVGTGAQGAITPEDEDRILARSTVQIVMEQRHDDDSNTRALVVPVDGTLAARADDIEAFGTPDGLPPLSYELDHAMMLRALEARFVDMIRGFDGGRWADWNDGLKQALLAHVGDALENGTDFDDGHDIKDQVMQSGLRAFYRSVGICATNMCR